MDKGTNEKQNKKEAQMTTGYVSLFTQRVLTECLWNAKFCVGI